MHLKKKFIYLYFLLFILGTTSLLGIVSNRSKITNKNDINFGDNKKNSNSTNIFSLKSNSCKNKNELYLKNNINKIYINISESRKWNKNLFRAITAKSSFMILDKYKKRFNGIVFFYLGNNLCKYSAKIRISGSQKDHLEIKSDYIISSIDINLLEGNINGIKSFKLFIPKTRNHKSEVITAIILRRLGFISPRTFFVDTSINNRNHKYILQEKPSKEMIDFYKLKDSALFGINNNLLYELRSKGNKRNVRFMSMIFPELINYKWAQKNNTNSELSFKAMRDFSKLFQGIWSSNPHEFIPFSDYALSNKSLKSFNNLREFRLILFAMGAEHALWNNNRKFYYEPSLGSFLPIYYDGNSRIMENYKINNSNISHLEDDLLNEVESINAKSLIKKLKNFNMEDFFKDLKHSNVTIDSEEAKIIIKNIINNLKVLDNFFQQKNKLYKVPPKKIAKSPHFDHKNIELKYGVAFSDDGENYIFCKILNKKCFKIKLNYEENFKLLKSKFKYNDLNFYYAGDNYQNYVNGKNN